VDKEYIERKFKEIEAIYKTYAHYYPNITFEEFFDKMLKYFIRECDLEIEIAIMLRELGEKK